MDFEYVGILKLNVGYFDHEHYKCRFEMDRQKNLIEPCTENQIILFIQLFRFHSVCFQTGDHENHFEHLTTIFMFDKGISKMCKLSRTEKVEDCFLKTRKKNFQGKDEKFQELNHGIHKVFLLLLFLIRDKRQNHCFLNIRTFLQNLVLCALMVMTS